MTDKKNLGEAGAVADVAAKLTKAQRTACWNMTGVWDRAPHDGWRRAGQACSNLTKIGLAEKHIEDCGILYRLTPLGLAVRQHLSEQGATAGVVGGKEAAGG